jgi:hypothetical protein
MEQLELCLICQKETNQSQVKLKQALPKYSYKIIWKLIIMYFYLSLLTKIQLINYKEFLVWINLELICVKVKRAKIQKHRSRLSVKRYWNLWRHFRNQRWDLKEKHSLKWNVISTRRQSKLITYRWLRWGRGESMILERMGRWGCWGTY